MPKHNVTRPLAVGTDVKRLAGENPKRKYLFVYNNGTSTVEILGSKSNKYGEGIPVAAGASWSDEISTGAWFIVAETGVQDVRVAIVGE